MKSFFGILTIAGILITIALGVASSNYRLHDGGLYSLLAGFLTFTAFMAYVVFAVLDKHAVKGPAEPLSTSDLEHYRRNRVFVAIGVILVVILALLPFFFVH